VLRTVGRHVLENAFENSVKAIEARNAAPNESVRFNNIRQIA
jgi:hypothetical protein